MPAPVAGRSVRAFAAALLASLVVVPEAAYAESDVRVPDWLAQPGVRLVAVEFYATWCKPCMDAMPRWKALSEKYHTQGLRVVVVNTQDPDGGCRTLGFTPDSTVCDLDGRVSTDFGLQGRLPAAFLWSWQGNLLVQKGHIGEVENAVEAYLRVTPRAIVEAGPGVGAEIVSALRERFADDGKVQILASSDENAAIERLRREQQGAKYDEKLQCAIGREVPANTLLRLIRVGEGKSAVLSVGLYDVTSGCLVQSSSAPWDSDARRMAQEAVGKLLSKLRRSSVQQPASMGSAVPKDTFVNPDADGWRPSGEGLAIVAFDSTPSGARVEVDGAVTCAATPCKKPLEPGSHRVRMSLDKFLPREESLRVVGDATASWSLENNAAWLSVQTGSTGISILIDGEQAGVSPLRSELAAGLHRVEIGDPCFEPARADMSLVNGVPKTLTLKATPRTAGLRVEVSDEKGEAVQAEVRLDGATVGRTWKNLAVPACGKQVEVVTPNGTFQQGVSLKARDTLRVAGSIASEASAVSADGDACPFVKPDALKACEASFKGDAASCDSSQSSDLAACATSRSECLEAERAARGIGPTAPSKCGAISQRCVGAAKRSRGLCAATAGDAKGACTDGVESRAARCAMDLSTNAKSKKSACAAQCRTEAIVTVNACTRTVGAEKRTIAAKLDEDRVECVATLADCKHVSNDHCEEIYGECLQIAQYLADDRTPNAQSCIEDAQKAVFPCVRGCSEP